MNRFSQLFSRRAASVSPGGREQTRGMGQAGMQQEYPLERKRRYSHFWLGFALLVLLAAVLAGLLMWRFGLWAPIRSGHLKELFRARWSQHVTPREPVPPSSAASEREPLLASESPSVMPPALPSASAEPPMPQAPVQASAPESREKAVNLIQRYALEFGPFLLPEEADRAEAQLNQAGLTSTRFRRQSDGNLFSVFVEGFSTPKEAQAVLDRLTADEITAVMASGRDPSALRVGEPAPLRVAVQMGERLRAKGYQVRVAAQPEPASHYTIRHGSFMKREEAEAKSRELALNGLPNSVVQVK